MDDKTIRIECVGHTTHSIDEFTDLQGNLKELSKENYEKLKNSILTYGFSFPVFCWQHEGVNFILDAHQRIRALKTMRDEGYTIPPLPTDYVFAPDRRIAKEKLLVLQSVYGKMTNESIYEFIHEPDLELDMGRVEPLLELPQIDLDYGKDVDLKPVKFFVVVECQSDDEQENIYNRFAQEGLKVKKK